jgi:hypothetical protein
MDTLNVSNDNKNDKIKSNEVLKPWVGSIRTSMDKLLKKR